MSKNIYGFVTFDSQFLIIVDKKFLKKCKNPEKYTMLDLKNKFFIFKYLHNALGPAVIRYYDKGIKWTNKDRSFSAYKRSYRVQYWLNGEYLQNTYGKNRSKNYKIAKKMHQEWKKWHKSKNKGKYS